MKISIFTTIIVLLMCGYAYSEKDSDLSGYVYNWQKDTYYAGKSELLNKTPTREPASIQGSQKRYNIERYNSKEDNFRYIFFN